MITTRHPGGTAIGMIRTALVAVGRRVGRGDGETVGALASAAATSNRLPLTTPGRLAAVDRRRHETAAGAETPEPNTRAAAPLTKGAAMLVPSIMQ